MKREWRKCPYCEEEYFVADNKCYIRALEEIKELKKELKKLKTESKKLLKK